MKKHSYNRGSSYTTFLNESVFSKFTPSNKPECYFKNASEIEQTRYSQGIIHYDS